MARRNDTTLEQATSIKKSALVRKSKLPRRSRTPGIKIEKHTWSRTSVRLAIRPWRGGPPVRDVEFNLAPFRLTANSLLIRVLQSAPFPIHAPYAYALRRTLTALQGNASARRILSRDISEVTPHDLNELFIYIEDVIQPLDINQSTESSHSRAIFRFCSERLINGKAVKEFKFKSRFPKSPRTMKSGKPLNGIRFEEPIDLVPRDFNSLEERNEKALAFGLSVQEDVINLCETTLNQHEEVLEKIHNARSRGIPKLLKRISRESIEKGKHPHVLTLKKLPKEEIFQVAAILCQNPAWALSSRDIYFPYVDLEVLYSYCLGPNAYTVIEVLLSEYCLPRLTVTPCAIAIIALTAVNSDVIKGLTLGNILERGNHIYFIGIKGRSGQLIDHDFVSKPESSADSEDKYRIDNPVAVRALKLLIENARKIEARTGEVGIPLLNAPRRRVRYMKWEPLELYYAIQDFWDYHKVHRISPTELRRLCAHIVLLSPGETIFSVQVLLGHEFIETTIEYVNSNIITQLLDANIRRFGEKLAATTLFATNRLGMLKEHGLTENDVQPLLFPVSKFSEIRCLADEWINSSGDLKISIGTAEINHCATQYKYYKENFNELLNENPRRFSFVHLPRIFFCISLRKVILASPHGALIK